MAAAAEVVAVTVAESDGDMSSVSCSRRSECAMMEGGRGYSTPTATPAQSNKHNSTTEANNQRRRRVEQQLVQ